MNGTLAPTTTQAGSPSFDHGLVVGDGVFETIKVAGRRAVRADPAPGAGCARSAAGLGLPEPDPEQIRAGALRRARGVGQPGPLARLRITVTGGDSPLGSRARRARR